MTDPSWIEAFDAASATYDAVGVEYFGRFGRRLVELLDVGPGDRVLDLGTGRGACLFPAAERSGPSGRVVGVDLAPGMVDRTSADVAGRGLTAVDVVQGDVADPPVEGHFDVITCSLVILFLEEPATAVRRWHDLLVPGGRIGLTTFTGDDPMPWLGEVLRTFTGGDDPGEDDEDEEGDPPVGEWLRDAGFRDVTDVVETHTSRFESAEHYERWMWSHGGRRALSRIPEDRRDALREVLHDRLRGHTNVGGRVELEFAIRYTTATA